ncbi:MAG: alpha/beta hydrolase [Dehalococcoidia bacterium]
MPVREGAIESDGAALHYVDWGGNGPPLVLIHATGFLAALWRPIAERLTPSFRVVAMDQRGHGDSDKPATGYSFETFSDDLQRLIDGLQLERPIAAGHSSGGTTIVAHAARHPGVISRAILIEPILPRPEWFAEAPPGGRTAFSLADGARKRRSVWPSRDELYEAYRTRDTFKTWREDVLRLYVEQGTFDREDGQIELKCPPECEAMVFEATARVDTWEMLPQLQCPTLLLWGAESHLHARGLAASADAAIPNGRTVIVDGTSHFLPQERPDEIVRLVEGFLAD